MPPALAVFSVIPSNDNMKKLENLVWPHIRVKIEDRIKEMKKQATEAKHKLLVDPLGCVGLIDADKLAHKIYEPGSLVHGEIAAVFGSDLINERGEIERSKLGAIVFNNAEEMSVSFAFCACPPPWLSSQSYHQTTT